MAITQISIENGVNKVKRYNCLTTDLQSAYPTDGADGSVMVIIGAVSGKASGYCSLMNGRWQPVKVRPNLEGVIAFVPIADLVGDLTIDFEDATIKNVVMSTPFDIAQVETATLVGTITGAGDITVTITSAIVVGSPLAVQVAVLVDDTPSDVAEKIRVALQIESAVSTHYVVSKDGDDIILTVKVIADDDTTLNIAIADDTAVGVTTVVSSVDTVSGGINAKTIGLANVPNICKLNLQIMETNGSVITWFAGITWLGTTLVPAINTLYDLEFATFDGGTSWIEQA
jgi:hypothetical protein